MKLTDKDNALVRRTPLFGTLSDTALLNLLSGAGIRPVKRGELLFVQGDPVAACFVVLAGWIKLFRLTPGGDEAVVSIFTRGQSFAEAATFMGGRYPVTGEAVTDGRLLSIPAAHLIAQIRQDPEVSLTMLASTSMHLHDLVRQIEQLKSHTGTQRVAEFLMSLCNTDEGSCTIELPYDKTLIAGRLGMKPESLSRAFAKLRQAGLRIEQNVAHIESVRAMRDYSAREHGFE